MSFLDGFWFWLGVQVAELLLAILVIGVPILLIYLAVRLQNGKKS